MRAAAALGSRHCSPGPASAGAAPVESAPAGVVRAAADLARDLGRQGVVDVDHASGRPRVVARLDGYLTGPSDEAAEEVVRAYLRAHPQLFGLDADDLAGLRVARAYTSRGAVQRLVFEQRVGGVPVLDGELVANVTTDGRLVNVLGAPLPDVAGAAGAGPAPRRRAGTRRRRGRRLAVRGGVRQRAGHGARAARRAPRVALARDRRRTRPHGGRGGRRDGCRAELALVPARRGRAGLRLLPGSGGGRDAASGRTSPRTSRRPAAPALQGPYADRHGRRGRRRRDRRRRGHPTECRDRLPLPLHAVPDRGRRRLPARADGLLVGPQPAVQLAHEPQPGRACRRSTT